VLRSLERVGRVQPWREGLVEVLADDGRLEDRRTLVLPSGETARNQSGLADRSTSRRSNGTRFSASTIAARCTYGHSA
jgi:hypothetical protein